MKLLHDYFDWPTYSLPQFEKQVRLKARLEALTAHHRLNCAAYERLFVARAAPFAGPYSGIPFLPVRLFKEYDLVSVPGSEVFKTLTSSGTTSQNVSRILIDRDTAGAQSKALVRILQNFMGNARLPMLIIDHPGVIKNRLFLSARGAGILGLSNFGRDHTYALKDETMAPDLEVINAFLDKHKGQRILLFGFTFMVWKYFYQALATHPQRPRFDQAILIHSGGWKKLHEEAVDNPVFKRSLNDAFGIRCVHDFYGMVEQAGSIFMECEHGRLHAPAFADILIRDPHDWSEQLPGRPGVIHVLSALPTSYPGHSLLTEDVGEIIGHDDCPCGRLGASFRVFGRLARAELRGCSDTAAIHHNTKHSESAIEFLTPLQQQPDRLAESGTFTAFSAAARAFTHDFSSSLLARADTRRQPELAALAYWMRKSNISRLHEAFIKETAQRLFVARGTVFHIAPSNVDTVFVYSWLLSLLSGNSNIVRLPSKRTTLNDTLIAAIVDILAQPDHAEIARRNVLLRYPADDAITTRLSALCDVRVIWGGDQTVSHIRQLPLPAAATELVFANKYSLALIHAAHWLATNETERVQQVNLFWNDAYGFGQMACSSPRLVLWVGTEEAVAAAADDFWDRLDCKLHEKLQRFSDIDYVNKLVATDSLAIEVGALARSGTNNSLVRVQLDRPALYVQHHCGAGMFFESRLSELGELVPLLNRTVQTVSYFGWKPEAFRSLVASAQLRGIDRIVPFGRALDFSAVWDGYDLIRSFLREITVS